MIRNVRLASFECPAGHGAYVGPDLLAPAGSLYFRSPAGQIAIIDPYQEEAWDEIARVVRRLRVGQPSWIEGELIQEVVGHVADPAEDGSQFGPSVLPSCPVCGGGPTGWRVPEPPMYAPTYVVPMTFVAWRRMTPEERLGVIALFMDRTS